MNNKLLIIFGGNGYSIYTEDGITPMEFVDGTHSAGYNHLGAAINACRNHGYKFEVI